MEVTRKAKKSVMMAAKYMVSVDGWLMDECIFDALKCV